MKAPTPPDPYATAAAQTTSNQQTAQYNAALNRVSQYTPYGNQVYSQSGTDTSGAPIWRSDISLTPQAQQQLDNQMQQNNQLSQLGFTLGDQAKTAINTPYSSEASSRQGAQDAYYAKEAGYLDPQFKNQGNDLAARLANQGVVQGSDAYGRAQDELARQKTFAYGQAQQQAIGAGTSAQATALQNQSTLKNAALNQLNALRTGTQIQNPTFTNAPSATAAGTDISGLIEQNYGQQSANANNFNQGLFGLAGAGASFIPGFGKSDRRLKENIVKVGEMANGIGIYIYNFIGQSHTEMGVIAQEVLPIRPDAVRVGSDGFYRVNYAKLD